MVAAPSLPSTEQVLAGLREEVTALVADLVPGTVGMRRGDALDLAERIEELGREVDRLRVVAARAVDLAASGPVGSATVLAGPGSGDEAECAPLLISPDDGCSPFAKAKDLLRDRLRISGREATRRLRLAGVLCERITTTGEILPPLRPHLAAASPDLDAEASAEIVRVLERASAVPDVGADVIEELEKTLAEHARTFDPDRVRTIGRHAVAVLDPDGAEPDETAARSRQGVHIGRLYNGLATVRLVVDAVQLEVLQTAFDAGSNPRTATPPLFIGGEVSAADESGSRAAEMPVPADERLGSTRREPGATDEPRPGPAPGEETRTRPQRQLDALVAAVATAVRHGVLPDTGGTPTQVVVTIDARDLAQPMGSGANPSGPEEDGAREGPPARRTLASLAPPNPLLPSPGVALLPHAGPVPAQMVRHLACDATITAVVLGNGRRVLDVGQSVRIVPPWMRLAVIARDGTECAFPGCSIPAGWCEAHHIVPWQRGGPTSVDNTVMLCPHHHALTDRGDWTIHRDRPGATPRFRVRR